MLAGHHNDRVTSTDNHPAGYRAVKQHTNKELVVVKADAVGDPGTVMVVKFNAHSTTTAVERPRGLNDLTSRAHAQRLRIIKRIGRAI